MQVYTVHEQPRPPAGKLERGENLVFVRDGFSWGAALFAPLWMLLHRMWLVLIGYLALQAALDLALARLGVAPHWLALTAVALHLALGFEASSLRRWTLTRKGWRTLGAVTGTSLLDAERRFFEIWLKESAASAKPDSSVTVSPANTDAEGRSRFRLPWRWPFGARA